jgi:hypothetical protein
MHDFGISNSNTIIRQIHVVESTFKEITSNRTRQRGNSNNPTTNEDRRSETEL